MYSFLEYSIYLYNSICTQNCSLIKGSADPGGHAVCGLSLAGIVVSNPVGGMDACLL
jgi:hypothetical protein